MDLLLLRCSSFSSLFCSGRRRRRIPNSICCGGHVTLPLGLSLSLSHPPLPPSATSSSYSSSSSSSSSTTSRWTRRPAAATTATGTAEAATAAAKVSFFPFSWLLLFFCCLAFRVGDRATFSFSFSSSSFFFFFFPFPGRVCERRSFGRIGRRRNSVLFFFFSPSLVNLVLRIFLSLFFLQRKGSSFLLSIACFLGYHGFLCSPQGGEEKSERR